jgi:hypothetical protein
MSDAVLLIVQQCLESLPPDYLAGLAGDGQIDPVAEPVGVAVAKVEPTLLEAAQLVAEPLKEGASGPDVLAYLSALTQIYASFEVACRRGKEALVREKQDDIAEHISTSVALSSTVAQLRSQNAMVLKNLRALQMRSVQLPLDAARAIRAKRDAEDRLALAQAARAAVAALDAVELTSAEFFDGEPMGANGLQLLERLRHCWRLVDEEPRLCEVLALAPTLTSLNEWRESRLNTVLQRALATGVRKSDAIDFSAVLATYAEARADADAGMSVDSMSGVITFLQHQFLEAVNSDTRRSLFSHAMQDERNAARAEQLSEARFGELASVISEEHFVSALQRVLSTLADLLTSHSRLAVVANNESFSRFGQALWEKSQRKVAALLGASTLSGYQIDTFLEVLDKVNTFVRLGEGLFPNSASEQLLKSVRRVSRGYFEEHHASRLEDLCAMISNEIWEPVPLPQDFRLEDVRELRRAMASALHEESEEGDRGNPFRGAPTTGTAVPEADDDELSAAAAPADSSTAAPLVDPPLLAAATINVAKLVGKYIDMMRVLSPIAYQVFIGITQLYDYYLMAVHSLFVESIRVPAFFSAFDHRLCQAAAPDGIKAAVEAIRSKLRVFTDEPEGEGSTLAGTATPTGPGDTPASPVPSAAATVVSVLEGGSLFPTLSPAISLDNANTLHGLQARLVALGGLRELSTALQLARPAIMRVLPPEKLPRLDDFYARSVTESPELYRHALRLASVEWLPYETLWTKTAGTSWNSSASSAVVGPSAYVDRIREELKLFVVRLDTVAVETRLTSSLQERLWAETAARLLDTVLDAYARAKKVSDTGQLQRKLDVGEISSELTAASGLRPLPRLAALRAWLDAYYLDEMSLLPWVKEKRGSLAKAHMQALLTQSVAGRSMKKQLRKDLNATIDEIFRR